MRRTRGRIPLKTPSPKKNCSTNTDDVRFEELSFGGPNKQTKNSPNKFIARVKESVSKGTEHLEELASVDSTPQSAVNSSKHG